MTRTVSDFLRGRAPSPRPNGEAVDWAGLIACLGAPERPFSGEAYELAREEMATEQGNWRSAPLAARSFVERATQNGLLPEAWAEPSADRQFAWGVPYDNLDDRLTFVPPAGLEGLAELGAAQLRTAEALLREALHRHWSPALRTASPLWVVAQHRSVSDDYKSKSSAHAWIHYGDEKPMDVPCRLEATGAVASLRDGYLNRPGARQALGRACAEAATDYLDKIEVASAVRWAPPFTLEPMTLLGRRLWAMRFLDEVARVDPDGFAVAAVASGPTFAQIGAFYAPLLDLLRMGFLPGVIASPFAQLLAVRRTDVHPDRATGQRWR